MNWQKRSDCSILNRQFINQSINNRWDALGFRVLKLINFFLKNGQKRKIQNVFFKLRLMLKEYFGAQISNVDFFLDKTLKRLEPIFDLRKPTSFRKKKHKTLMGKQILIPYPCTTRRRVYLGLCFFVKAIQMRRLKIRQISLTENLFREIVLIKRGLRCNSFFFKKQHICKVLENRLHLKKKGSSV